MSEFRLTIELGNEAMQSGADVSEAIVKAIPLGTLDMNAAMVSGDAGPIRDVNGNTVGRWYVEAVTS